jgi:DNA polymerase III subunit gamma/tau
MSLINKYRPTTFDEVVGHQQIVKSLRNVLKKKTSKGFLFVGQPGVGKTSLARIVAKSLGCEPRNIIEVDGASKTGIGDMQALTDTMQFSALGKCRLKFYIIDEAQRLSPQAFASLLKSVEEPPPHVYFCLCTTDPQKIPAAFRTQRCLEYVLNPVSSDDIYSLLGRVVKAESWETSDEVLDLIAQKSGGSPRKALASLAMCAKCQDRGEAAELLRTMVDDSSEAIELCRALAKGTSWTLAMKLVKNLGDVDGESVRQIVLNYFSKAVQDAKSEDVAAKGLAVLQAFERPYLSGNNRHCLLLSLGELLLG